ncbi:DNA polymerase Y family protein [Rudaeicoccus suwonensis]|uniref:Protein ImuB n=1 Tax=Rudaeicoccus suwonensis TaxID=657409 RepID=A0A561E8B1_9MICO|nr:DNA polymerase Y family protein [Rudaeicoccus suwonensis]TWE11854.1 protein ImuB [Rudaeicoccus suwonensis]
MTTSPATADPVRVLLLWCPGWSVLATRLIQGIPADAALALTDRSVIVAASDAAVAEGVTAGLRLRQAQHRCPDLIVLPQDTLAETRAFEPMVRIIEDIVPDVHVVRPGIAAVKAQGPRRFYGGESEAAYALFSHLRTYAERDLRTSIDLRVAVADGLFTAEHAARNTTIATPVTVIPPGGSAAFLAGLPVSTACDKQMSHLLQRMGIRRLGEFAKLPRDQVHARFGAAGLHAHKLACGQDAPTLNARTVPADLTATIHFEPPTDRVEQIIARCRPAAARFTEQLTHSSLVCTEIRVGVQLEPDGLLERIWRHPWQFGQTEILDRVRWQLEDIATDSTTIDDEALPYRICTVQISPESVDAAAHHAQGLWGDRPDERIELALTGLQHRLGHDGVLTSAVGGGRLLHERRILWPWGDALPTERERRLEQPWPGSMPGPAPATVFAQALTVRVHTADGTAVTVNERGALRSEPVWLLLPTDRRRITSWAGPWPINQRWWRNPATVNRFQLADNDDAAWLVITDGRQWWAEGRYD